MDSIEIPGLLSLPSSVIDFMPLGVVVLNAAGEVVVYNRYEEQLARRRRGDVIGRHFFEDVAECTNVPQLAGEFRHHVKQNTLDVDVDHVFALPFHPRPRDVRMLLRSFAADGDTYAVCLIEDVTARRELQRQRDRLISTFVHDLNSPLTGALGYAQLLETGDFDPLTPEQQDAVATIRETCERMTRLIRSTLAELTPSDGGQPKEPVNLHALVLSSLSAALPAARGRDVAIYYNGRMDRAEFPSLTVTVTGYANQLGTMVDNLLSNAVKYARSEVRVELTEEAGAVTLAVSDDGRGVPADVADRIFEHGYQAPNAAPGHGIGLASVVDAIEQHSGTITLDNDPGNGASFRVRLPA